MKRKVIIADDEQHICHLIKALIEWEQYGLEVVGFANDGNKAFQMCEECSPDFLITDIRMPGLSGIELIRKLYDAFPDIKVIIITGYSQFSYAQQALKFRVVDYLCAAKRAQSDRCGNRENAGKQKFILKVHAGNQGQSADSYSEQQRTTLKAV